MRKEKYIQLPPIPEELDGNVVRLIWEYTKLPEKEQQFVYEQYKVLSDDSSSESDFNAVLIKPDHPEKIEEFGNNMKAVIALIGVESDRSSGDIYRNPEYSNLTWGEVAILSQSGLIEFASHTYDLHSISGGRKGADKKSGESAADYRQILTSDLVKNQGLIESAAGRPPLTFAWPFGAYPPDKSGDPILKDVGFVVTFTSYQHTSTVNRWQPESLYGLGRYLRTPSFDIKKII